MHISVPVDSTMELINFTEVSPLVSKCQIKVCYVGENRNKTFISKEVATEMGRYLPGSPIVGFYNTEAKDFEEHNREISLKDGKFSIIDTTRPYGFVSADAKVWFQKFIDDGEIEREYLVTEGYIWTGAYPESKRIIEQGNNQSMEITNQEGYWSGAVNGKDRIFIINEALIERLCILGENFEPCFEGSQIKTQFSLQQEFEELKNTMFKMINEFKEALNEGGSVTNMENEVIESVVEETPAVEETPVVEEPVVEEPVVEETPAEEFAAQKEEEKSEEKNEDKTDEEKSEKTEDTSEGKEEKEEPEKKKYNLEEVSEYIELKAQYEELQSKYSALELEKNNLAQEIAPLQSHKLEQERKEKQAMIDTFYMLSDEDKADVVANIDTYSLDDIEAKLAVICVRNKNFGLEEDKAQESATTFSLDVQEDAGVPAWIKAVKETASRM